MCSIGLIPAGYLFTCIRQWLPMEASPHAANGSNAGAWRNKSKDFAACRR